MLSVQCGGGLCLTLNISVKSSSNSTFWRCFRILRSSRIKICQCCLILNNISCRKMGKTNATNERVRYCNSKIFDFINISFPALPQHPEAIAGVLQVTRHPLIHIGREWEHAHYVFETLIFLYTP